MNVNSLSSEISTGLAARQTLPNNVSATSMDRCFTNSSSANVMNEAAAETQNTERLIVHCLSHMLCNTGDKAEFILIQPVWTYLQKVFALSTVAQGEWEDVTGMKWPTFSETCWFSK